MRASGITWTSPTGKKVRYKNSTITRTCTVNYPRDVAFNQLNCETYSVPDGASDPIT